ncbi:hypothetical protein [Marasmitruncus massiliensis]|uniref:hypothetical protein n=1 Tax=Marasmitruncus massiliensis TaxID=1944642 RepID=UPI000C7CBC09|nr:hypothetical protein [Marasmitruncus massiliensis]
MSRFINRIIPLVLAVIFLLAAAGTSFFVVLGGSKVLAEGENPTNASIIAVKADDIDIISNVLSNKTIKNLVITVKDTELTHSNLYQSVIDFKFNSDNFYSVSPSDVSLENEKMLEDGSGLTYDIKLTNITYTQNEQDKISFTITYQNNDVYNLSHDIALPSSPDPQNCSIGSYQFYDGSSEYNSSIYPGTILDLKVEIIKSNLTAEEWEQIQKKIQVSLTGSSFSEASNYSYEVLSGNVSKNFYIRFNNVKYLGGNKQFAISLSFDKGATSHTLTKTINQCVVDTYYHDYDDDDDDDDDDDSSSKADIAPPTPNIIVTEYDYGGGNVPAAGNFTLKVTFKNTSKKLPIDNIVMKVTVPEAFTMTSSSNTFYVEKLGRDSAIERTMSLSVKPNAEPISQSIKLAFSFEAVIDETRKQFTSEEEISIPVVQLDRFSLNPLEVPEMIFVGEGTNIEATFVNKGKTPVYNVSAEITGNISKPGQKQFIGNIEAGKEETADFSISADMPGEISGEVVITYEDANMHVGELRAPFSATAQANNVMPPDDGELAMNPEGMEAEPVTWLSEIPIWTWVAAGVVLIILFAFAKKLYRAHKEKKMEEQDEDF